MSKFEFKLPDIGEGVTEGEIVNWLAGVGDSVKEDQDMVEVMTDKATVTIGAPKAGKIAELKGEVGDVVPVGQVLVVLDLEGNGAEKSPAAAPAAKPAPEAPKQEAAKPAPAAAGTSRQPPSLEQRAKPRHPPSVTSKKSSPGWRPRPVQTARTSTISHWRRRRRASSRGSSSRSAERAAQRPQSAGHSRRRGSPRARRQGGSRGGKQAPEAASAPVPPGGRSRRRARADPRHAQADVREHGALEADRRALHVLWRSARRPSSSGCAVASSSSPRPRASSSRSCPSSSRRSSPRCERTRR